MVSRGYFEPRTLRIAVFGAAGIAALFTLLVSVLPWASFAYRSPVTHGAIEATAALVAFLAGYLVFWRYSRSAALGDLLLCAALLVQGAANLVFSLLPTLSGGGGEEFATWAGALGRMLGALLFVAAAFAPARRVPRPRLQARIALGLLVVALGAIAAIVGLAESALPRGIEPGIEPEGSSRPRIVGDPAVLALQATSTLLFAAAAAGFMRRAARTRDEFLGWLAIAAVFGAFARLNYFLFPSLYSEWVYTGDALRLVFFVVLLVGAAREIASYQRAAVEAATLGERRRLARDLHDGLAQDLTFLAGQARWLARQSDDPRAASDLANAADRALDDARDAIGALTRPMDETADAAVARAAEQMASRWGTELDLRLEDGLAADSGTRHALVRIVREAMTNAARHGKARHVEVDLRRHGGMRLRISDDGSGFDPATTNGDGLGLASMRERAELLGGRFSLRTSPGDGTTVEVEIPSP